jgi:curved DNA-binding protein CbpA
MRSKSILRHTIAVLLLFTVQLTYASIQDHYCGIYNCYDLLNVTSDASLPEIRKAFREKAKSLHPDKNADRDTTEKFIAVNRAYEVLKDESLRAAYDEYLRNPEAGEMYHYYKYYGAKYSPQTNPFMVVFWFLTGFSLLQFAARHSMYHNAMKYIENTPQFRARLENLYWEAKNADPKATIDKKDFIPEAKKQV